MRRRFVTAPFFVAGQPSEGPARQRSSDSGSGFFARFSSALLWAAFVRLRISYALF
jgi:hypothetical protein